MLLQELKTRVRRQIPTREQIKPMALTYGANLIAKIPEYAFQAAIFKIAYDALHKDPDLVSLGIATYAICALPQLVINSYTLEKVGWNAGYKTTTLYKALDVFFPKYKRATSIIAEAADQIGNVYGFSLTGITADLASQRFDDQSIWLSQRFAAILTTGMVGMVQNINLLRTNGRNKGSS